MGLVSLMTSWCSQWFSRPPEMCSLLIPWSTPFLKPLHLMPLPLFTLRFPSKILAPSFKERGAPFLPILPTLALG